MTCIFLKSKTVIKASFIGAVMATYSSVAHAQSNIGEGFASVVESMHEGIDLLWPDDLKLEGFNARIGAGFGFTPDYLGSDDYRFRIIPIIDIRYKERLRLNGSLLTYAALKKGHFEAGPLLNLSFGRPEDRNEVLRGLREIGTTLEAGVFARYQTSSGLVSVSYRHALSEDRGDTIRLTAGHGIYKNGNFVTFLGIRANWLSNQEAQRQFGITPEEAETSEAGLPAFAASSGVSDVSANLVGAYRINNKVRILSLLAVGRLLSSDARNSPLVRDGVGSETQFTIGIGFTSQF